MNFKRQFLTNAAWSSLSNGASSLVTFLVFALVVRQVDAEAIGVVAFAMVFIVFGRVFVEAGTPELILRRPTFDQQFASVAFWLNLANSALAFVIFACVLAPLVDMVFQKGSGIVLAVISLSLFADASRVVHEAKFRRDFNYRALAIRNTTGVVVSGAIGVWAAYAGLGVWALVAQRLVGAVVTSAMTWFSSDWRPSFVWSKIDARDQVRQGAGLLGASTLKILVQRIPELALGIAQGPLGVAVYGVGLRTYEALFQLTAFPLLSAAMSSFARLPDRETLGKAYVSTIGFFSTFSFPVFFGTAAIAQDFVPLVFGRGWQVSSEVLLALAIAAPPTILGVLLHPVLNALGRTALIFWLNLGAALTMVLTCLLLAGHGPIVLAAGLAFRAYLGVFVLLVVLRRELGLDTMAIIGAAAPPFLSSLAMFGAVWGVRLMLYTDLPTSVMLLVSVMMGAATYAGFLFLGFRRHVAEIAAAAGEMFPGLNRFLWPLKQKSTGTE
ncbi:oligosaccharide flippase family protein [Devosia faecipullorum]|uniref:oligosaccharide flippase family protein n=1 Tax=Devosia faecipullorum TaxID=2755039 RepID=UPI00187B120F|nr:oligosaccharide flippase family protein [Devosia faecipullorum]MBE7731978.1 oligosaccharide flippase family protein [Devosia faecipullorum]